ncbi:hypothetical protein PGQ11_008106 [Apiospora arundinis]|uniref:Uncharacterized protein n=1 Tax=Apiospora arundinis TaxID=335852 RepID=A0ABR2IE06_9PEZI
MARPGQAVAVGCAEDELVEDELEDDEPEEVLDDSSVEDCSVVVVGPFVGLGGGDDAGVCVVVGKDRVCPLVTLPLVGDWGEDCVLCVPELDVIDEEVVPVCGVPVVVGPGMTGGTGWEELVVVVDKLVLPVEELDLETVAELPRVEDVEPKLSGLEETCELNLEETAVEDLTLPELTWVKLDCVELDSVVRP